MASTRVATPADLARLRGRKEQDLYAPIISAFAARGVYLERKNAGLVTIPEEGARKRRVIRVGSKGTLDLAGWATRHLRARLPFVNVVSYAEFPSGCHVEIEVKRPGEIPTRAQVLRQARMVEDGCLTATVHSVADVAALFR